MDEFIERLKRELIFLRDESNKIAKDIKNDEANDGCDYDERAKLAYNMYYCGRADLADYLINKIEDKEI